MMQELSYIRCGDYYIPDIRLPEENRSIGRLGRMHRIILRSITLSGLILFALTVRSGRIWLI